MLNHQTYTPDRSARPTTSPAACLTSSRFVARQASDPFTAVARAESLARLPDVLPPAVYAGVAAFLDGADDLPEPAAAEVRRTYTASAFAAALGIGGAL